MAVQTDEVREIIDFAPEDFLVTSFYLDCDAGEFPSDNLLDTSFDSIIHQAESKRKDIEDSLSHDATESVRGDLAKIREFYQETFDRTDTNGLAIFSCSGLDFWDVIQMPTRVGSRVEFGPRPFISPVARFISHSKATAVLVSDRQQARIFTMKQGDVREWTSFEDWVPRRSHAGGWSQMRYQRRSDNFAKHHVDHAAELTLKLLQHYPFEWLILGADVDAIHDVRNELHPYLKDRVIGEIHVRIDAPMAEIIEAARARREEEEGKYIGELLERVQEYAGAGGRGTIGLANTLQAINEQKVHILLLQDMYAAPGWFCPDTQTLFVDEETARMQGGDTAEQVDDVVELAVQRALELGSTVEVATEFNQLEPIDCIGSIMYY